MRVLIRPLGALLLAGGALLAGSAQSAPPTPTGFSGTAISPTSIAWDWNNVSGEVSFAVHDATHAVLGTTWQDLLSWTETGLSENTAYVRHVHAVNGNGSSGASTADTIYTAVHDPVAADFSLAVISASQINVTVTQPPNPTTVSTGCLIERSTDNATWGTAKSWSSTYTLSNTGLIGGTTYYYRITYRNADGETTAVSPALSATTTPGAPATPTGLAADPVSTSSILWDWNDVAGETGYELHDASHAVIAARGAGVLSYLETGLTENTLYSRHIHSLNAAGSSAASAAETQYTRVEDPTTSDFTLTVISGTQINVAVTQPPNGTTGTTGCQIERSTDALDWTSVKSMNSTYSLNNTGLVVGTTYYYRVRFRNGDSSYTTPYSTPRVATTTAAAPPAPSGLAATSPSTTSLRWTWDDVNGETGYRLHGASETLIATPEADVVDVLEAGLAENTQYGRHVHAFNGTGQSAASSTLNRYTRVREPSAADVSLTVVSGTQITVTVTPPANGSTGTSGCQIDRSTDNATWTSAKAFSGTYTFNDTTLIGSTTYHYRVRFRNGDSTYTTAYSPSKSAVTQGAPPPAPAGLAGAAASPTSIVWSWDDGSGETGYAVHDGSENVKGTTGVDVATFTETGLTENAATARHVHGTNAAGTGAASSAVTKYTMVHPPTTGDFTLTAVSSTRIDITCTPPPNGTAGTTGVEIGRSTNQTSWTIVKAFSNTYTYSNTGLTAGTLYYYRIRFRNGNSVTTDYSPARTVTAPPAPTAAPAAPGSFAGVALSTSAIQWTWGGVADEASHELHDASHAVIGTTSTDVTVFNETGLGENTSATRHVHAVNAIGASPASTAVTRWTGVHTPTTADFSLTVVSATQINVTVTPLPNGTTGYSGCAIQRSVDNIAWTTIKSTSNVYTDSDTGLVGGTTYYYRILYRNGDADVTSPYSPPLSATTLPGVPAAPGSFAGVALSPTALRWTWANVGGETGFALHDGGEVQKGTADKDILAVDEIGLSENTAYTRHVHALNAEGLSAGSAVVTRWTSVHTPTTADFSLSVDSATQITVTVVPPPNGTSGSTGCEIQRSPDGFTWATVKSTSNVYVDNDTGLVGGTTYHYRIRYRNGDADEYTAYSPPRSATTSPGAPAAPATFTGTPLSNNSILWSWGNVGGETSFLLHDAAETVKATPAEDVLSFLETGLGENAQATRHVHAVNAAGTGTPSPSASEYTLIHEPTTADFTLEAVSGTQINVTVTPPANPTAGTTGCEIQRSPDTYNWTTSKAFSAVYVSNEVNLVGSTTYYYRIRFRNGDGVLTAYSPLKSVTTPAAPPAAPAVATAAGLSMTSIKWNWLNVQGEDSYQVQDPAHAVLETTARDVVTWTETGLSENTSYTRHVHAVNASGPGDPSLDMVRYTWIHNPTTADFTLTPVSSTQIDITVTPPPNSATGTTAVAIQRSTDGLIWSTVKLFTTAGYTFSSTSLAAKTTYHYRIQFRNGDSTYTTPWSVYNSATTFIAAPAAFTGVAQSSNSILWSWGNVTGETGFLVHDATHQLEGNPGPDVLTFLEDSLQENTAYPRHVHAYDAAGTGSSSATATKYTKVHDPAAAEFTATAVSPTQIDIAVTPPPNGTAGTTGVEISRSTDQTTWTVVRNFSNVYTFSSTGLTGSTLYYYRIRFRNGDSIATAYSPSNSATTWPPPPAAPTTMNGTITGATTATWSWSNVANETGFELHDAGHAVKATVGANVLSYQETGLPENTYVSRHVHAFNASGASAASLTVAGYTVVHDAMIADFTMSVISATQIDVLVVPPPNSTLDLTAVEIERSLNGNNWTTVKAFTTPGYTCSDTGVTNNKDYEYRIRFRGATGYATAYSPSQIASTKAPSDAPGAFTGAGQSASSILWSWSEIVGETSYQVHDANEAVKASSGANVPSALETGLIENGAYTRHAHAYNGLGGGPASASATRSTLVHDATIADFAVVLATASQVNVTVAPPPNSTAGSTSMRIERSTDGQAWTTAKDFGVAGYSFSDLGLAAGTLFHYRIRFQNANGIPSAYSTSRTISTPAADAPFITTAPKKTRSQATAVAGTAAVGMTVKVYFNGVYDGTATGTSGSWTYVSISKPEGTYTVVARASNGGAESGDSNPITITVDITPPPAPTNVRTTPYNNTIDVDWDPSGAADVAGYQVFRRTGPAGPWELLNSTGLVLGTRYRDSTALNGTLYFYRVSAFDDALNE